MRAQPKIFLGFDYGTKRIGIAVGQVLTASARPLTTLRTVRDRPDWDAIERLIETWKPDALVVGVPLNMDGSEQDMTRAARRFGARLQGRYGLPVHYADERLSTREAHNRLIEGGHKLRNGRTFARHPVDAVAAQIVLQAYINEQHESRHDASQQ